MAFLAVFGFLLGLAVGSFLNVVILRGAREENVTGRSRCESCGKVLAWHELIPLLSFAFQIGRCRTCGAALSWQYPLVEFVTGVLFAASALYFFLLPDGGGGEGGVNHLDLFLSLILYLLSLVILSSSIVVFVSDLRWRIIPNGAVLLLFLSGLATRLISSQTEFLAVETRFGTRNVILSASEGSLFWDFGAALAIALFFAAIWFITKGRGMGFGDAKLVLATSLILGFPASVVAALLTFWIGAAVGILLLLLRIKSWKDQIPFGPYILLGTVLAYFLSEKFIVLFGGV